MKQATIHQLNELDQLAVNVINHMIDSQIPQWDLSYPRKHHLLNDIEKEALYIYQDKGRILGALCILPENDPPYLTIDSWIKTNSIVIHRVLVDPLLQAQGIGSKLFNFAKRYAKQHGYDSIKIDTHIENYKMRQFLKKQGFIEHDYLPTINRLAYEYVLEDIR